MKEDRKMSLTEAKALYASSNLTLRQVAKDSGIPERTIFKASKRDNWQNARRQHCSKVVNKTIERTSDWKAKILADGQKLAAANALRALQHADKLIKSDDGLSPKELLEVSKAVQTCFVSLREAIGESAPATKLDITSAEFSNPERLAELKQRVYSELSRQMEGKA